MLFSQVVLLMHFFAIFFRSIKNSAASLTFFGGLLLLPAATPPLYLLDNVTLAGSSDLGTLLHIARKVLPLGRVTLFVA